ncbi:hypothetical protein Moror_2995 [Moniliophthora roreri MCA 2997]|uniref:DUF7702 domain-containing protein n=1 Tax=Moniliophthora roreri (strain MCA 2997) TaxID=1381753 RepID=V2WPH7_MONRO|nr:hypothetical protein Moror_2995 [Moniliophthora roreri MCA 2997]KAI3596602.1 hypothetical protein WG66_003406 [Moniliophthora roreri]
MTSTINYARYLGYNSVAAAIVFTILYVPLLAWFLFQLTRGRSRILIILSVFCAIRIAAFAIRAVLCHSSSAGEDLGLVIADQVLFSVGFFGLLYGAYGLVMDRLDKCDYEPENPISRLTGNRNLFRLVLLVAVILGSVGTSKSTDFSNSDDIQTGKALHEASIIIFLILTVLQTLQTVVLIRCERRDSEYTELTATSAGAKYGAFIFVAISLLLLIREAFVTATLGNQSQQSNEQLWYPLITLTEFLCVVLFTTPGLIPPKGDVKELPR